MPPVRGHHESLCVAMATCLFSLIKYTLLTYKGGEMPWGASRLSSMVCIPAWSFYKLSTLKDSFRENSPACGPI